MFEQQQTHVMQLRCTYPTGVQEWVCPTCGRHFLMQWPPAYKRIILDPGDQFARHSGGTGGLSMGPTQITTVEDALPPDESPEGTAHTYDCDPVDSTETPITDELQPWLKWLMGSGLGDKSDGAVQ